jgi:low temperature requirement protein LtrA
MDHDPAASGLSSGEETEWFEVFFDLVFAVAVAFWAEDVARDPRLTTYLLSLGSLLPIWWIWLGDMVYAMRFGEKSPRIQALALVQVVGVGVMSTQLLEGAGPSGRFAVGYLIARVALLAMYALAGWRSQRGRPVAVAYLVGFGLGAALWAVSLVLPDRLVPWAQALGLGVDFAVPWVVLPTLRQMPLDWRRVPARVGTFTSLVLGVSVEGIVRGLAESGWNVHSVSLALLSFAIVMALWWIYAARVNRADLRTVLGPGQSYLYCHFFIVLGVGTSSVGVRVLQAHEMPIDTSRGLALLAAGIVFWILGLVLIREVVLKHRDRTWFAAFSAAALAVPCVAALGTGHPTLALAALAALVLGLALVEVQHGEKRRAPASAADDTRSTESLSPRRLPTTIASSRS